MEMLAGDRRHSAVLRRFDRSATEHLVALRDLTRTQVIGSGRSGGGSSLGAGS